MSRNLKTCLSCQCSCVSSYAVLVIGPTDYNCLNIAAKEIIKMWEQMFSSNSVWLTVCQVLINILTGE